MIRGVSISTTSVCLRLLVVLREEAADDRQVAQAGDAIERRPLFVADQAGEQVGLAVLQPDRGVDVARAERRQVVVADAGEVAHLELQPQRDVVVVVQPRRDLDVDADGAVGERGDRLLVDAAGGDRREGHARHRHVVAEARRWRQAVRRAQLRVGERAARAVGLEQPVVEAGQAGDEDVRLRSGCAGSRSVSPSRLASTEPSMPRRARRGDLQAVLLHAARDRPRAARRRSPPRPAPCRWR